MVMKMLMIAAVASMSLAACQTGMVYVSPPLHTRVIDAVTEAPIANVSVTMWSTEVQDARQRGLTDRSGFVDLPRLKGHLSVAFPFVGDRVVPPAIARFEVHGYISKEVSSGTGAAYFDGAAPIRLAPLRPN